MTGPFILSTARHAQGPVLNAEEKRVAQGWELGDLSRVHLTQDLDQVTHPL